MTPKPLTLNPAPKLQGVVFTMPFDRNFSAILKSMTLYRRIRYRIPYTLNLWPWALDPNDPAPWTQIDVFFMPFNKNVGEILDFTIRNDGDDGIWGAW